jgi:TP901 family phage tail tape measure protein
MGITSTLGFSIGTSVVELEKLIAAMTGYNSAIDKIVISSVRLNSANTVVQASLKGMTVAGQNFTATMKNAAGTAQLLGVALTEAGDKGSKAGQRVFISWQNILRIGLIYPVISKLVSAFAQGTQGALDLEKQIAEIRTISQDAQLSTERWREGLIKLAVEFGRPVSDVATAAYQAISNQVTKGAESFSFLRDAMDFGRATVASTTDSVNLLSSVLNSYNLNQNQTREVAAQLFKTIELGRIQTKDLANSFGRVGPTASQLGVDLRELNSALALLTIQGVKPNVALTFLEQLLIKLQKPTDEMAKALKRLGVPTGEQAIATFGLVGILEKLGDAVARGDSELGKLLPTVRGYQAFVSLAANGTDKLREVVEKNTNSQESYNKAIKIGAENLDTEYKKAIEAVKAAFLPLGRVIDQFVVDTVKLTRAIADLFDAATGGSAKLQRQVEGTTVTRVRLAADAAQLEQRLFEDGLTGQIQSFNQFVATVQGKLGQLAEFHRVTNRDIISRTAEATHASEEFVERTFAKMGAVGKANLSEVQKIDGFIREIESKSEQLRFAGQIREIEQQKKLGEQTFAQRRATAIKEIALEVDTNQEIAKIRLGPLDKEEKEFFAMLNRRQQAIQLAARQEDRETFARRRLETPKAEIDLLVNRIQTLEGVAKTLLETGIPDEAQRTFTEINKLLDDLVSKTSQVVTPKIDKTHFINETAQAAIQQAQRFQKFREDVLKFEADSLRAFERPAQQALNAAVLIETLEEKTQRLLKARKEEIDATKEQNAIFTDSQTKIKEVTGNVEGLIIQSQRLAGIKIDFPANVEKILEAFRHAKTAEDFNLIATQIDQRITAMKDIAISMQGIGKTDITSIQIRKALANAIAPLEAAREALLEVQQTVIERDVAAARLAFLRLQATEIEKGLQAIPPQITATIEATNTLAGAMSGQIKLVTDAVGLLSEALQHAVDQIRAIQGLSIQPGAVPESRGGFIPSFFARGGFVPHGTDTIPAMLTAGEFVINRDSTRAFLPLLRQINQTRGTKSLASGGVVTTVGDINISVEGGKPASQTVKQIGKELRRQIRRGTIRLN